MENKIENNTEKKIKRIVSAFIIINIIVLSVFFFCLEKQSNYLFTKDDVTNILGVVVSCISIVITAYLVILAIDGYGKIEAIKKDANDAKQCRKNAEKYSEDAKKCSDNAYLSLRQIGDTSIATYEYAINLIEKLRRNSNGGQKSKERYMKWREETYRNLYSLGLNPFLLDEGKRVGFIKKLSSFAREKEIKELKVILNSNESKEIKDAASLVIQQIEEKNQSGNGSLI